MRLTKRLKRTARSVYPTARPIAGGHSRTAERELAGAVAPEQCRSPDAGEANRNSTPGRSKAEQGFIRYQYAYREKHRFVLPPRLVLNANR